MIDVCSMVNQDMHGSGMQIVNSTDSVQLEIERKTKGSGDVKCHVFIISDYLFNLMDRQLESVQD